MSVTKDTENAIILELGTVIADKWVILDFIGKGAMGEVYRAHQINLQRDVAIKVVSKEWLQSFDEDDREVETSLQRFRREVQAMAQIRHPNVVQVYDYGTVQFYKSSGRQPLEFIVMEHIPGHSMRFTMSEEGYYPEEELVKDWLVNNFLPVLDGVEAIHRLDVIHRDLKPENILLDGDNPKIADFGLARSKRMRPVTHSMDMKGTLHYMSPEHFFDFRKADKRADIYSLGKILFEAVNGKFSNKTTPFRQVSLPAVESEFFQNINEIILDATAEQTENRIDSVVLLRRRLESAIKKSNWVPAKAAGPGKKQPGIWQQSRWIWSGVAAALISTAVMTVWHLVGVPNEKFQPRNPSIIETGKTALPGNGAVLRPIPGGQISLLDNKSGGSIKTVVVAPFQIEEAPVTNHQFIEFLNSQIAMLKVNQGVVREKNDIWLLLSQVMDGYEPIVYKNGRFTLTNAGYASHPVLRVTPYGASAYAAYYGRRLPTRAEWQLAMGKKGTTDDSLDETGRLEHTNVIPSSAGMDQMHYRMQRGQEADENSQAAFSSKVKPKPITSMKVNVNDLRVMGNDYREWAIVDIQTTREPEQLDAGFVLMPTNVLRKAWEAFEYVGFRCVEPVKGSHDKMESIDEVVNDTDLRREENKSE